MYLISAEGYKNAGVDMLIIRKWSNLSSYDRSTHWNRSQKHVRFSFEINIRNLSNKKLYKRAN